MNAPDRLYTPSFFRVLIGAMLTMVGVSMQFHFGEYIAFVGFDVNVLGWIAGVGVIGSLILRPYAGAWIDRFGCRPCFLIASISAAVATFSFQLTDTLWIIGAARILVTASNATFLATVAVFAANAAPTERRAESLGTVGVGGFLGMMIGPAVGDAVFAGLAPTQDTFRHFFTMVAGVNLLAGIVVINLRFKQPERHVDRPSFVFLLRRYWPGRVLLVCVTFAACITIQMTFLERFAESRGFEDIRSFFFVYGPTAIALRIFGRRVPQIVGRRRLSAMGLCAMGAGTLLIIPVRAEWHLILPALLMGAGHAFVFPSMVDLVADSLPDAHRGVGTSIALGGMDIGFLSAGIVWGQLIDWRGFETTFIVSAACAFLVALLFAVERKASTAERSMRQPAASTE